MLTPGPKAAMKVSRGRARRQLGARIVEQDAARLRGHEVVGALQDLAQCPSSRTSQRSCPGRRAARARRSARSPRATASGSARSAPPDSGPRPLPCGRAPARPASRGISVGRSGSLTRDDYITFPAILRCPRFQGPTPPEPSTIPLPSPGPPGRGLGWGPTFREARPANPRAAARTARMRRRERLHVRVIRRPGEAVVVVRPGHRARVAELIMVLTSVA